MMAALYAIFVLAPVELTMGIVQKIFYFHVASAWVGFLAIYLVCFCSLRFLRKRDRQWDVRAASAAEVGAVFLTLNPGQRTHLGQAGVGDLVDLGCPAHHHLRPLADLHGLPDAAPPGGITGTTGKIERRRQHLSAP